MTSNYFQDYIGNPRNKTISDIKKYYQQVWEGKWLGQYNWKYSDLFIRKNNLRIDGKDNLQVGGDCKNLFCFEDDDGNVYYTDNLLELADDSHFLLGAANNKENLPFSISVDDSLDVERLLDFKVPDRKYYKDYTQKKIEDEIIIYQAFILHNYDKDDNNNKGNSNNFHINAATKVLLENDLDFITDMIFTYRMDEGDDDENNNKNYSFAKFMRRLLFDNLGCLDFTGDTKNNKLENSRDNKLDDRRENKLDDDKNNKVDDDKNNKVDDVNEVRDDKLDGARYNKLNNLFTHHQNNKLSRVLCEIVFDYITNSYFKLTILNDDLNLI